MLKIHKTILLEYLFVCFILVGCATVREPRIVGTFISDKDVTMTYLQDSGKFTERQLNLFSGLLGKLKLECDGVTVVSTLDDYITKEPVRIIKRTSEYVLLESNFLGEPFQYKMIFTEDGYWWVGGVMGPDYREKFVRIR